MEGRKKRGVWEGPLGGQVDKLWRVQDKAQGFGTIMEGFLDEVAHRPRPVGQIRQLSLKWGPRR